MDYKDAALLGKIMKKVSELRLRYYIDCDGSVRTFYNGDWWLWETVLERDERLGR
jgi:hypothetical protein